jgi:hypothetical protein
MAAYIKAGGPISILQIGINESNTGRETIK